MARMSPGLSDSQLDCLDSRAEAKLYRALRDQVDDRYLVLHSVSWIRGGEEDEPKDGEADFVVFDPHSGFVVIEVKGGGIAYNPSMGIWSSQNRRGEWNEIKDPFRQATTEKYAVLDQLRGHARWRGLGIRRVVAGHSVFLPDISDLRPLETPSSPSKIMGGRRELEHLSKWLSEVFRYWAGNSEGYQALGTRGMKLVEELFCRPLEVRPLVSARLRDEEVVRVRLTNQQARVLRFLGSRRRASISGGAGTGKTLLAVQKARELAEEGMETLLICFNRQLADHLKEVVEGLPRLLAMSFHQLCTVLASLARSKSGRDLFREAASAYPTGDRFDVQMPYALALATEILEDRFDAIVVDEGQDFKEEYWFPVELILRSSERSALFVFHDPNQAIYNKVDTFPIEDEPFVLNVNCRNTRYIHDISYRFFKGYKTEPSEIEGTPANLICAPSIGAQAKKMTTEIVNLLSRELVPANEVVVLVAGEPKAAFYNALEATPLPRPIEWAIEGRRGENLLLADTVRRFKGLEAGIVFLWGVDGINPDIDREVVYIGTSRAKSVLYLVGSDTACERILRPIAD